MIRFFRSLCISRSKKKKGLSLGLCVSLLQRSLQDLKETEKFCVKKTEPNEMNNEETSE